MQSLFHNVKVAEVADLASNLIKHFNETGIPEDAFLENAITDLDGLSKRIIGALKRAKSITSLESYAQRRGKSLSAIRSIMRAGKNLTDGTIAMSLAVLKTVFDEYLPAIAQSGYSGQTAFITSMLDQLAVAGMSHHVDAVPGMRLAVNDLAKAQNDFVEKRREYQRMSLREEEENATELSDRIRDLINGSLIVHLEDRRKVQPDEYADLALLVDSLVRECNLRVQRRRRGAKKESSSELPTKE